MLGRPRRQALLLERYWSALRGDRAAAPPEQLDPELAETLVQLRANAALLRPDASTLEAHRRRLAAQLQQTTDTRRAWSGPAIDPAQRRRTARAIKESEERVIMSDITTTRTEPIPIQKRRWSREVLKIAAAVAVFAIVGLVLVLVLRGGDQKEPQVAVPVPTQAAESSPTVDITATRQAAHESLTATALVNDAPGATAAAESTQAATAAVGLPEGGTVAATISVGPGSGWPAAAAGSIWVSNAGDGTVSRIDPSSNNVVATVTIGPPSSPKDSFISVSPDGNSIWVVNNDDQSLVRIDPEANQVVQTIEVAVPAGAPYGISGLAAGDQALWVTDASSDVQRIDPTSGAVVATIETDNSGAFRLALTNSALWVQTRTTVYRIDPATNQIVATIPVQGATDVIGLAASDTAVWTGGWSSYKLYRIDPATNQVVATLQSPMTHPAHYALSNDSVWIASNNQEAGELGLIRIDLATDRVVGGMPLDSVSNGVLASDGSVWLSQVSDSGPGHILRIDPTP